MALTKEQKKERVAQTVELLKKSQGVVLAEYGGLAAPGMNALRSKTRDAQGEVRVVKNTLAAIAMREAGLALPGGKIDGNTLIAFGVADIVGIAKAVVDAAKESEFVKVKGGYLDGKALSADEVKTLAALPPLPVIRARLAGVLKAPAGKIAGVLSAPARNVVGVCKAYSQKQATA
ncbi:MAG: 50S ribosomal protein L10 [Anaerolineales bacterium]|nr:50S ribosomal protein L10 [Anaerolineales bacterium]